MCDYLENDTWEEKHALYKQPKKGKCKESKFKNGNHRVGYLPKFCPNDGGLRGAVCEQVCLDCGKQFKDSIFVI